MSGRLERTEPGAQPSPGPCLITGGAGFIGRRLALGLRQDGMPVRVLVRLGHDATELSAAGVHVTRGDAADPDCVAEAADGCPIIYHLAAARGPKKLSYRGFQNQNRRISEAMGEGALAAGGDRVVVASTATFAIRSDGTPQDESAPARPNSAYRASRVVAERVLEGFRRQGLEVVTARVPQRVMGPGTNDWTRLVRAVRDGAYRILPRDGTIHSGDVDDVVDGLRLCGSRPGVGGERFLLGGPAPSRLTDVLRAIAECLRVDFEPILVPAAPVRAYVALGNAVFRYTRLSLPHHFTAEFFTARVALDLGKARRELGYRPRFDMPESIARTVSSLTERGLL